MGVAGSSRAKLLATFCDNILKNGGSEKLSDEAIEDILEKVFELRLRVSILMWEHRFFSGRIEEMDGCIDQGKYQHTFWILRVEMQGIL
ncbi:hypothetical protein L1987_70297 [Smallanthus sonchifolius]|uniref:Uncharacterized protein n=1 Tax=Smallanthus sonchifolius TaxID=185202 RepID=A0ACB9AQU1_9ASTR|nr:hypothetical protein L1987_70297 [Smallanthus sonchifolius]